MAAAGSSDTLINGLQAEYARVPFADNSVYKVPEQLSDEQEAVGVPATFELATDLIRPGGRVANIGVRGHSATLHLERLWTRDVTITTGLVDTRTIPQLMNLVASGRLDPTMFATHHVALEDTMSAYDTFADATNTGALEIVLNGTESDHTSEALVGATSVG